MGNSIKEDIERLKLCSTNQCNICGRYEKEECMLERNRCEQHILSDYNRALKKNEVLLKENEEFKEYLITQNCEINRLNLDKIRLELSQVPDTTEQYKYLKNEYKMRLERTDLENYKQNYLSIQKVKDKIEELNDDFHAEELEDIMVGGNYTITELVQYVLQELIEEREEK